MKIGIHALTPYAPSLPNRGELGEAKTATIGGTQRQRLSSQSLKRAWRTSSVAEALEGEFSVRTRRLGLEIAKRCEELGMSEKESKGVGLKITGAFGKPSKKELTTDEVVILGHEERNAAHALAETCAREKREPTEEEITSLPRETTSIDVALFGRMRAAQPKFNVDAAVAVSHALTVNRVVVEADFWTAVDDLNKLSEDSGSGGMGEREYGSGCYYTYVVVDFARLTDNLAKDLELVKRAIGMLIEVVAVEQPGGHRTSFAHDTRADYVRVEVGDRISGNLMLPAFEEPVEKTAEAIAKLKEAATRYEQAYDYSPTVFEMDVPAGKGTLKGAIQSTVALLSA